MTEREDGAITRLLRRSHEGDAGARRELFDQVYGELRRMAGARMNGVPNSDTLQPTALVHEIWLRLERRDDLRPRDRAQFFAVAARAMHDVLVEQARKHAALKHGGGMRRVELTDGPGGPDGLSGDQVLDLEGALLALREVEPLSAEVVLLRFFGGLTHAEVADALDVPVIRARREWDYARAFLLDRLDGSTDPLT